jgi:CBS domain-containing protein
MSPRTFTNPLPREAPLLHVTDTVADAVRAFLGAVFPGYLKELKYAGMIKRDLEDALEKRQQCRHDEVRKYVHTEHVDVGSDFSDAQVAEIFMHHRVLIVPVTDHDRVVGVITRADFFRSVAQRFLSP